MTQTWDDLKGSDVIDSRDIIDRIAELESTLEDVTGQEAIDAADELAELEPIAVEGFQSFEDWRFGVQLIRDDYFEDFAEQFAEDIGAINSDASWPLTYIDWAAAAAALQQDYTSIDIDGTTYWGR